MKTVPETGGGNRADRSLIEGVSQLPHKILQNHESHALSQLVLHELGHEPCFGLKRAVYLFDNPDCDHLQGVAGFCKDECHLHGTDLWGDVHAFGDHMKDAQFHNTVRQFEKNSITHDNKQVHALAQDLGIEKPQFFSWITRHGNHGLLLFEPGRKLDAFGYGLLKNAAGLLSLCSS